MCLFLVCVLFLFLVCVMCLCTLASLRSAGARFARCGRFAAAAAASRPQAITPNIIVFVVHGLTFVNVSALDNALVAGDAPNDFGFVRITIPEKHLGYICYNIRMEHCHGQRVPSFMFLQRKCKRNIHFEKKYLEGPGGP